MPAGQAPQAPDLRASGSCGLSGYLGCHRLSVVRALKGDVAALAPWLGKRVALDALSAAIDEM